MQHCRCANPAQLQTQVFGSFADIGCHFSDDDLDLNSRFCSTQQWSMVQSSALGQFSLQCASSEARNWPFLCKKNSMLQEEFDVATCICRWTVQVPHRRHEVGCVFFVFASCWPSRFDFLSHKEAIQRECNTSLAALWLEFAKAWRCRWLSHSWCRRRATDFLLQ